jgi:hydrogenase-1 operon protein HyaF
MSGNSLPELRLEVAGAQRGNIRPLLHEIRHALQQWLERGEPTVIDLGRIPMAPGEEAQMIEALGCGEVRAQLSALGPSEFCETAYAGVWLVTHFNIDEEITGRYIEITDVPALLRSQPQDMGYALERLTEGLGAGADSDQAEARQ